MRLGMPWVLSTSLAFSARRASVSHLTDQQKKLRAMGSRSKPQPQECATAGEWQQQVSEWAYLFPLSTCSQAPSPDSPGYHHTVHSLQWDEGSG